MNMKRGFLGSPSFWYMYFSDIWLKILINLPTTIRSYLSAGLMSLFSLELEGVVLALTRLIRDLA